MPSPCPDPLLNAAWETNSLLAMTEGHGLMQ